MLTLRDKLRTAVETGVLHSTIQGRSMLPEVRKELKVHGQQVESAKEASAAAFWREARWDHPRTKKTSFAFYKAPHALSEQLYLDCCEILTLQKQYGYVTQEIWLQRVVSPEILPESGRRAFERLKQRLRELRIPTREKTMREARMANRQGYGCPQAWNVIGIRLEISQENFDKLYASPRMFPHDYFS